MMICLQEDEFVQDKCRWVADIRLWEKQFTVYQDDDRPGVCPGSAWLRLKNWIKEKTTFEELWGVVKVNKPYIQKIFLQFRSHFESPLPENAEGYFFSNMVCADLNEQQTYSYFLIGHVEGENVYIKKYNVPALQLCGEEARKMKDCEYGIIMNTID